MAGKTNYLRAALKSAGGLFNKMGLGSALQSTDTGLARSSRGHDLHYMSVQTIDPTVLAQQFKAADAGDLTQQARTFALIEQCDAHIFSELGKRRRGVTKLNWQLSPPKDASQAELTRTEELADMVRGIKNFEDSLYHLTDAIGHGYSCLEIDWQTGGTWLPKELVFVPQRRFAIDRDTGVFGLARDGGVTEALRDYGWVVHKHFSRSDYIEAASLFRVLAWTYAYKAYNIKDMQRFLEVYGLPLRLGKYPAGLGKNERAELLRAVRNIGTDAAAIVPQTMSIDFIEASDGKVSDFIDAIEYWERKQSIAILGSTLTSQADGKSSTNALGKVHEEARRELVLHDERQISPTVTRQLIAPICILNGLFKEGRMPTFGFDTRDSIDQEATVRVLDTAVNMGMRISLGWAHERLQIPQAGKDDAVLEHGAAGTTKEPKESNLARQLLSALASKNEGGAIKDDPAGFVASRLQAQALLHEQALVQRISSIVSEAGNFEDALAQIEQLATEPINADWVTKIAEAQALLNLYGRAEAGAEGGV